MFKKVFAASLAGLVMAVSAPAATLNYVLSLNDNGQGVATAGRFAVYGFTSAGDNAGIASFNFVISSGSVSAVGNRSPEATLRDDDLDGDGVTANRTAGFTLLRLSGGNAIGTSTAGSQDTVSGNVLTSTPVPPGFTAISSEAQGAYGVTNTFTTGTVLTPTAGQIPVLLATGNFTTAPVIVPGNNALFVNTASVESTLADTPIISRDLLPEPSSLAVLGLAAAGLVARRRKA